MVDRFVDPVVEYDDGVDRNLCTAKPDGVVSDLLAEFFGIAFEQLFRLPDLPPRMPSGANSVRADRPETCESIPQSACTRCGSACSSAPKMSGVTKCPRMCLPPLAAADCTNTPPVR